VACNTDPGESLTWSSERVCALTEYTGHVTSLLTTSRGARPYYHSNTSTCEAGQRFLCDEAGLKVSDLTLERVTARALQNLSISRFSTSSQPAVSLLAINR
jgi:hypothetical protein